MSALRLLLSFCAPITLSDPFPCMDCPPLAKQEWHWFTCHSIQHFRYTGGPGAFLLWQFQHKWPSRPHVKECYEFNFMAVNAEAIMLHWCCIVPILLYTSTISRSVGLNKGRSTFWQSLLAFSIARFFSSTSQASSFSICLSRLSFRLSINST